ncbi:MAG: acyl-CoA synthetase [Pseudomonadota bacterium]
MYPGTHAKTTPNKAAAVNATTGEQITYVELDSRSACLAAYLRASGMTRGDVVAVLMENNLRYFEVAWAAYRSGLYVVTVSRHATVGDVAYVIEDSGARAIVSSAALVSVATESLADNAHCAIRLLVDSDVDGWERLDDALSSSEAFDRRLETFGEHMPYSSGTTGRPKGIRRPLPAGDPADGFPTFLQAQALYGLDRDSVYLSPAPLYHTAPIQFCLRVQSFGGTVVMMERFDAAQALRAIERYRITHSQWVPTMFVRLLKLDEAERNAYDLASHRCAIHAAAPCPVEVKHKMIEWWGPIVEEYYAGSERNGSTRISSAEWLEKPGSVGQPRNCRVHICSEAGTELPVGEAGIIYFEQPDTSFVYHNDSQKTDDSRHPQYATWSTLGDVGYLDEDGYLYLTDRQSFMIISGGVNIYPRMIEDALILHPAVADVAVIGVPNEEFGEEVKAIVEPSSGVSPGPDLEAALIDFARERLAHYMVPRSVDFLETMPRLPTGKLPKRVLREPYWADSKRPTRV